MGADVKPTKRPRDPNQLAKLMVDIATGEAGTVGGPARAKALTPDQRSEIASIAAAARWKKS